PRSCPQCGLRPSPRNNCSAQEHAHQLSFPSRTSEQSREPSPHRHDPSMDRMVRRTLPWRPRLSFERVKSRELACEYLSASWRTPDVTRLIWHMRCRFSQQRENNFSVSRRNHLWPAEINMIIIRTTRTTVLTNQNQRSARTAG